LPSTFAKIRGLPSQIRTSRRTTQFCTGCGFDQSRRPDAALCLPELLCPPPRDHTLRSEYSMDALNPGLLCPPDTREAPARRLRRPTFHFPHDFALDFSSHAPQSYLFPFSSAVGSAEGTEELTSCYGTNCDFRDGKEDRQGEEWVTWRSESPEWPWSA
jgi:hypothetical protein